MSLLTELMEDCCRMEPERSPDGEGGFATVWSEGDTFQAAIAFDSSTAAMLAEKSGVTDRYTIATGKDITLAHHEVLKRLRDGKVFRVTSDGADKATPPMAWLELRVVTAEEWRVP